MYKSPALVQNDRKVKCKIIIPINVLFIAANLLMVYVCCTLINSQS